MTLCCLEDREQRKAVSSERAGYGRHWARPGLGNAQGTCWPHLALCPLGPEAELRSCPPISACVCAPSCLTLCDAVGCSPLGSSVHGILQARILSPHRILTVTSLLGCCFEWLSFTCKQKTPNNTLNFVLFCTYFLFDICQLVMRWMCIKYLWSVLYYSDIL